MAARSLKVLGAYLIAACVCLCAGCAGRDTYRPPVESAVSKPVLRVGVCANAPPVIFKQAGDYAGIEAELARGLADALGMRLQFVDCAWDDLIQSLLDGKFDIIMSGMTITSERAVRIAFTEPYLQAGQMCLVRNDMKNKFPTAAALQYSSARVGTEKGTTGEFIVQRHLARAKKKSFSGPEKGARALMDKKIDIFVNDAPVIWWLASTYESSGITTLPFFLTQENIAWGVKKNDAGLLQSANRFIAGWKKDGRLLQLLRQWMPSAF